MGKYILGVQKHQNPSVCLLEDNNIVYFNKEETLNNNCKDAGLSIKCLEEVRKITLDIDVLGFTGYNFNEDEEILYELFLVNMGFKIKKTVYFHKPHHISHLFKSFPDSKFESALVIVWDGRGSSYTLSNGSHAYETTTVFSITNGYHECIYKRLQASKEEDTNYVLTNNEFYSSVNPRKDLWLINDKTYIDIKTNIDIGHFYTGCAHLINLTHRECNEIMRLSTLGGLDSAIPNFIETKENLMYIKKDICDSYSNFNENLLGIINKNPNNFFYHAQKTVEKIGVNFVKTMLHKTGHKNLILCGGVARNSLLNNEIIKTFPNINIFIDPICTDEGNSIGIARMCALT